MYAKSMMSSLFNNKKLEAEDLGCSFTVVFRKFPTNTDRLNYGINELAKAVGKGGIIRVGSFAYYDNVTDIKEYGYFENSVIKDLQREIANKEKGNRLLNAYSFIQCWSPNFFDKQNMKLVFARSIESSNFSHVSKNLASDIEDLIDGGECHNFRWSYNSFNEILGTELVKELKTPYFLCETFQVGNKDRINIKIDTNARLPFARITKTHKRILEKGEVIRFNNDSGGTTFIHLGSELSIFNSNKDLSLRTVAKNINVDEIDSLEAFDDHSSISAILSASGLYNLRTNNTTKVEKLLTNKDLTNIASYSQYSQGSSIKALCLSTPNNLSYGLNLFDSDTSFNAVISSVNSDHMKIIGQELSRNYKRLGASIYNITPKTSYYSSKPDTRDPFKLLDVNWDEFDLWYDCISYILSSLIDEDELSDYVTISIRKAINDLAKENKENWNFEGFYQKICKNSELIHLTEVFGRFRKDADLGMLFYGDKTVHLEKLNFDVKKITTALLLIDTVEVLFKIRDESPKIPQSVVLLWEPVDSVETGSNTAKFFESFVRGLRQRGASLVTLDSKVVSEESDFCRCIMENSPFKIIGTSTFNRKNMSSYYYEDLKSLAEYCGLNTMPEEECIIPEFFIFNRNLGANNASLVRLKR